MNYSLAATLLGDSLKYSTTFNEINRIALAIFRFQLESFPNENITSVRARCIYNWIMTLAKQHMDNDIRNDEGASGGNGDCRPTQYLSDHRMSMTDIRTTDPLVRFATTTSMMWTHSLFRNFYRR